MIIVRKSVLDVLDILTFPLKSPSLRTVPGLLPFLHTPSENVTRLPPPPKNLQARQTGSVSGTLIVISRTKKVEVTLGGH